MTTLNDVHAAFGKWLHMKDYNRLDLCLAVALSQYMKGTPLWMILVGSSGDGKTELLNAFSDTSGDSNIGMKTYMLAKMTAKTLVTGMAGAKDLAPELNGKLVIMPDMAEILSLPSDEKKLIWGQFRNLYDGFAQADTGGTKERKAYKNLRITFLAGSTPEFDTQILIHQSLGTRELIHRSTDTIKDEDELMDRVDGNEEFEEEMRVELRLAVRCFLDEREKKLVRIEIPDEIGRKIKDMCKYLIYMRAAAKCDSYTGELIQSVFPERPTRVYKQFKRLYMCLRNLDPSVTDERALELLYEMVRSNVNPAREKMMMMLVNVEEKDGLTLSQIANTLMIGKRTVLSELSALWNMSIICRQEQNNEWGKTIQTLWWWNNNGTNPIGKAVSTNTYKAYTINNLNYTISATSVGMFRDGKTNSANDVVPQEAEVKDSYAGGFAPEK